MLIKFNIWLIYLLDNDYSKLKLKTTKDKIKIICKVQGEFEQEAGSHLQGKGCIECGFVKTGNKLTKSHEEFL